MKNTDHPLVSVIIPAFNCAEFIEGTIKSVLDQTAKNIELIVIDDGSTDGTQDRLAVFKDHITLRHQKNLGAPVARNHGLEIARGDYVAFLDADDRWMPNNLSIKLAFLEEHPEVAGIFSNFTIFNEYQTLSENGIEFLYPVFRRTKKNIAAIFNHHKEYLGGREYYFANIFNSLFWGNFILTSTTLFRKNQILSTGIFNHDLITQQDYDYFLRISEKFPLSYVDEKCVHYRRHPGQLTDHKNIERIYTTVIRILNQYEALFRSQNKMDEFNKRQLENYLNLAKVYMDTGRQKEARKLIKHNIHTQPRNIENYPNLLASYLPIQLIRVLKAIF